MSAAAASSALLRLSVGPDSADLSLEQPGEPPRRWTLAMGTAVLWPSAVGGPGAAMVENAIQRVEDEIERLARQVPPGARLVMSAEALAPLQRGGAIDGLAQGAISLSTIERGYQSLAARAVGALSARGTGFDAPAGDALLLILRECLHHLGLDAVHLG